MPEPERSARAVAPTEFSALASERLLVATVALGTMLAPLNSTMVAVALPSVMLDFGADAASTSWLITAYLIAMASLQPVAGKLGDRLGRRRLMLGGLLGFSLASFGAALATSLPLLIFMRVSQAVSGAILLPNGDALLREIVPAGRRAARFGLIGSAIGLAAAVGPPLGGLLVSTLGWRAMFAVNLLIVLPALLLGWRHLPTWTPRGPAPRFDWQGALLFSAILASLATLLSRGGAGLPALPVGLAAVLLAALLIVFILWELRHPAPVVQLRFFLSRSFAAASGAQALSNLAMYTTLLAIPLIWGSAGRSSIETGAVLGVMAATTIFAAPIGGRLADRFGRRWPTLAGLALITLGTLLLALSGASQQASTAVGLAALGGGLGISNPGLQTSALESVERAHAGAAAGVYSTCRYLGSVVGSALLAGLAGAAPSAENVSSIFATVVVAALLATLLATRLPHRLA